MDAKSFRELLKAYGEDVSLTVKKDGRVTDRNNRYYGACSNSSFTTNDGYVVRYREISYDNPFDFTWISTDFSFKINTTTQDVITVQGSFRSKEEIEEQISIRNMPVTKSEILQAMNIIYPDWENIFIYNALDEKRYINMKIFDEETDELQLLDDDIFSSLLINIEQRLLAKGYFGKAPSEKNIEHVLNDIYRNNKVNFFEEWVKSHEWDGIPRMRGWFRDTFGATAPMLSHAEEKMYVEAVSEMWFLGGVARMRSNIQHDCVPVLIGSQGIGKSSAIAYTAGGNEWFASTTVSVDDPKKFWESVAGSVVVELEESEQIRNANSSEKLKSHISKKQDTMRLSYGRREKRFDRHYIMIATSNHENVFVDPTGNRRFYPMYCNGAVATREYSPNDPTVNKYDVEQVWAEAYHYLKQGCKPVFPVELEHLAKKVQASASNEDFNVSQITDYLNNPGNGYFKLDSRINGMLIAEKVFNIPRGTHIPAPVEQTIKRWYASQYEWEKTSNSIHIKELGKSCRGYVRVAEVGQPRVASKMKLSLAAKSSIKLETLPDDIHGTNPPSKLSTVMTQEIIRPEPEPEPKPVVDPDTVVNDKNNKSIYFKLRRVCEDYNLIDTGDVIPKGIFSDDEIGRLLDEGLIYYLKPGVIALAFPV